ncbi:MAG TPA: hypothetical protein VNC50_11240, partial [Planctomycetia bacterium]|nr:hypothetical protein [Planctomycetia bacterium]
MDRLRVPLSLVLLAALAAAAAAQPPAKDADPLVPFARIVGGEWKTTFASGKSMVDVWHWGPGRRSLRVITHGDAAAGGPWRGVEIIYWHPGRKEIRSLSLNPYAQSVSEGVVKLEGDTAETVADLHQTGRLRKITTRREFAGPEKNRVSLLEETAPGKLTPLVAWDYIRSKTLTPIVPPAAAKARKAPDRLAALEPLLGRVWKTSLNLGDGNQPVETIFERIPHLDVLYGRSFAFIVNGVPDHAFDIYLYHHVGAGRLRCLALSSQGALFEGDVEVRAGGRLELALKGAQGDRDLSYVLGLEPEKDGTFHQRLWTPAAGGARGGRTLLHESQHSPAKMSGDLMTVFQAAGGDYWFCSYTGGAFRYDGNTVVRFNSSDGLPADRVEGVQ